MKTQKGFTLIELVVVIVILGILAAVAAPKFIDISSDARVATLEGLEGAIKGGNSLVYSKALIDAQEKSENQDVDGITADYGYAEATETAMAALLDTTFADDQDWDAEVETADTTLLLFPNGITASDSPTEAAANRCYLRYTQATSSVKPTYAITDTDC